jgi:streptogramin lyase
MSQPFGVAVDDSYNYYIADKANRRVRRVDAETGIITTVAGDGTDGYSGDGGQGTDAQLGEPWDVAVDSNGDLYIADRKQHVVRKVTVATGIITTYAGNGSSGWDGDGGPATLAKMVEPSGLAFDASDNLYIADKNKHVVRKVDAATGIITTHAGNGGDGYDGDGGLATAAKLGQPHGLAVDGSGNLYIADFSRDAVRKVDAATGIISTYAGTGSAGYTGDGGLATLAKIEEPYGLAIDGNDNLYVAVKRNDVVRKVDAATGFITTVVGTGSEGHTGDGGLASLATLAEPFGLAIDREGDLYIADKKNNVIRRCDFGDPTSTIVSWTEAEP